MNNLFADLPGNTPCELFSTIEQSSNIRIERIVSHGHFTPAGLWYDQELSEWVLLLQGAARLRFEEEVLDLKVGDYVNIPAHRKHRVEWTAPDEPTIWLAVHYG